MADLSVCIFIAGFLHICKAEENYRAGAVKDAKSFILPDVQPLKQFFFVRIFQ